MDRIILIVSLAILCACNNATNSTSWDAQNIRSLEADDPAVKKAIEKTQENMFNFIRHYRENSPDTSMVYFVKSRFSDHTGTEHMWINVIAVDSFVHGIVDNIPQHVSNISYRDTITLAPAEIEDFIIYRGDTILYGDYLTEGIEKGATD